MLNIWIDSGFFTWLYMRQSYIMYISQYILKDVENLHIEGVDSYHSLPVPDEVDLWIMVPDLNCTNLLPIGKWF